MVIGVRICLMVIALRFSSKEESLGVVPLKSRKEFKRKKVKRKAMFVSTQRLHFFLLKQI